MENNLEDIVRGTYHMFTAVNMLGHQSATTSFFCVHKYAKSFKQVLNEGLP